MNDLASLNGKPVVLKVGGRDYRFHPLSASDLGDLQAWINSVAPDPFVIAHTQIGSGRFTVEQGKFLLRTAMELAVKGAPKLGSEDADLLLQSPDGIKEVLYLAVHKGDPAFTRTDAEELCRNVTQNDLATMFRTSGLMEGGMVGEAEGPKAGGSGTETTGPGSPLTGGGSTTI